MPHFSRGRRRFHLTSKHAIHATLIAGFLLFLSTNPVASASLCQLGKVGSNYPHQSLPNQQIQVNTSVAGSCASDGENYFSIRVDVIDKHSNSMLSSNSVPIGYNAKNFSVIVQNVAVTPQGNVTWPLGIDVYVIESGGLNGKYLLMVDNATIQVGVPSAPELQVS